MSDQFTFTAPLWIYSGKGAWHFVTLPLEDAARIRFLNPLAKGFAPIPVQASIGETRWRTALFPDSKSGSYLLAIKADVRKKENLDAGDQVLVTIAIA